MLSWWQLFHPLPGYQWNSGTSFIAFRVHQECLLFSEKSGMGEKELGDSNFQGVCKAYFPSNVLGNSKLEWAQECTFVNTSNWKQLLFPVWWANFKLTIWFYSEDLRSELLWDLYIYILNWQIFCKPCASLTSPEYDPSVVKLIAGWITSFTEAVSNGRTVFNQRSSQNHWQ